MEGITREHLIRFRWSQRPNTKVYFKFNGGHGAILCSVCSIILAAGREIDWDLLNSGQMKPQYCVDHTPEKMGNI